MNTPRFEVGDLVTTVKGRNYSGLKMRVARQPLHSVHGRYVLDVENGTRLLLPENALKPYDEGATTPTTPLPEVSTMSNISKAVEEITTITFVNGTAITSLTDEAIVSLITETRAEIDRLKLVDPRPKRVQTRIDTLRTNLLQLVELVDALDSTPSLTERLEALEAKIATSDK